MFTHDGQLPGPGWEEENRDYTGTGDAYGSPLDLVRLAATRFGNNDNEFDYDFFANHHNALARNYFTLESPVLPRRVRELPVQPYYSGWANPPYSHGNVAAAVHSCWLLATYRFCRVVALLRCDTSTSWWRQFVHPIPNYDNPKPIGAHYVYFLPRLRFRGAVDVYNFPNALVVWHPGGSFLPPYYSHWID